MAAWNPSSRENGFHFPSGDACNQYAGTLNKLTLENFQCFSFISIDFNGQVNQIVGNTSGKSAIQKAIFFALGFGHGLSRKDLIRSGCKDCKIELVIDNAGKRSFQKLKYGDEIIIQRMLTESENLLALKNQNGNIVSTQEDDLKDIMIFFGLKTDLVANINECNLRIASSMGPQDKYNLFLEVTTNLDEVEEVPVPPKKIKIITLDDEFNKELTEDELELNRKTFQRRKAILKVTQTHLSKIQSSVAKDVKWTKQHGHSTVVADYEKTLEKISQQVAEVNASLAASLSTEQDKPSSTVNEVIEFVVRQNDPNTLKVIDVKTKLLKETFQKVLQVRGLKGELIIDHTKREIQLPQYPFNGSPFGFGSWCFQQNMKYFFAMAFMIALWRVSDQPFLSVDDFHLFTDPRPPHCRWLIRLFIECILELTNAKPLCQFILLMREDTSKLKTVNMGVFLIRLMDLERLHLSEPRTRENHQISRWSSWKNDPRDAVWY